MKEKAGGHPLSPLPTSIFSFNSGLIGGQSNLLLASFGVFSIHIVPCGKEL